MKTQALRHTVRQARRFVRQRRYAGMTNAEIFSDIYRNNLWGGRPGEFYSGSGSTAAQAEDFCAAARRVITENGITTVLDVGCGDFRVGSRIAGPEVSYLGIDVVTDLIAHNNATHAAPRVAFRQLDITTTEAPPAELALIRQVFQHLSNEQIRSALQSLRNIPLWLVAEHFPSAQRFTTPNVDKKTGDDVRALRGSAVSLADPPFNLKGVHLVETTQIPSPDGAASEEIRIFLVENPIR